MSVSRFGQWVCIVAAALTASAFQGGATPEKAIEEFAAAFVAGDLQRASTYVVGGKVDPALAPYGEGIKREGLTLKLSNVRVEQKGDTATVSLTATTGSAKRPDQYSEDDTVTLKLGSGGWQIVPPPYSLEAGGRKPISTMASMLSEGMGPIFARAKESAKAAASLSNIKQLALATLIYAGDYGDTVKTTVAGWHKAVLPYAGKMEVLFKAPGATGKGDSYTLNKWVAGVRLTKVKLPAETVMVYQGKDQQLDFAHGGRAAVAFCDGHAKLIDREAAKKLRWKP